MGKALLAGRLAVRDLRHRPAQAALLLLAITAATAVLTLGLVLHGVTSQPYQQTRAATRGPDVGAYLGGPADTPPGPAQANGRLVAAQARALDQAPGVTGHSGPYPVASAVLRVRGLSAAVEAEGRGEAPAAIEQPALTAGSWVQPGGIVIERTFAEALGATVGERVTVGGRPFTVTGIAVTAASPPYPNLCYSPGGDCVFDLPNPPFTSREIGLAWVTGADARALASPAAPLSYFLNLRLGNPADARAFASHVTAGRGPGPGAPGLIAWQDIAAADGLLVQDEQQVLSPGALLAVLLAVASAAVLAGGRMAERTLRIGLLKAVGGTPVLIAAALLAENLVLALGAAAAGLAAGCLAAPLIDSPGAALVGAAGAPSVSLPIAAEVTAVALAVAFAATLVPAIRAARTSTVSALAATARPPRRHGLLIRLSALLPVPLLLGLRLVARKPRRAVLTAASIAVTVPGIVTVLTFHTTVELKPLAIATGLGNPVLDRDEQMLTVLTVVLLALSVLNAICATWATALDTAQASALSRVLGATPRQVSAGLSAAQVIPALPGVLLGVPLGIGLFAVADHGGPVGIPPVPWLAAALLGTLGAVAVLTAIPAWLGTRRPPGGVLQSESA